MSRSDPTPTQPGPGPAAWRELARAAVEAPGAGAPEFVNELLVIELAGTAYALPIERVREIVRLRVITRVPRVPAEVRGVTSLRGEIFQVVDLRRRLGLPAAEADRRARIVVLHGDEGRTTGLLVDAVREVRRAPASSLRPPAPGTSPAVTALCLAGEEFVSLLDVDGVLDLGHDAA